MIRGGLDDEPFAHRVTKNGDVTITWRGQVATTLRGNPASAFLDRIERLDAHERQLAMAKVTGNFRRGNES